MRTLSVQIAGPDGVHARPAARIAACAGGFRSDIRLQVADGRSADAKSIMAIMMLALRQGTELEIRAEGPDEDDAVDALADLVRAAVDREEPEG